jgi:hypothetical protein
MSATPSVSVLARLAALQTELVDEACTLDRRGRVDASDMANMIAARLGQLCHELEQEAAGAVRQPATSGLHSSAR